MKESLDQETQAILAQGEKWKLFVEGEMWKEARKMLLESQLAVESIHALDVEKPEEMIAQIKARKLASEMVNGWISEIEGQADQYNFNKDIPVQGTNIITHH